MALKSIRKALGFPLFRALDPAIAESHIKPVENEIFGEPTSGLVDGLGGPAGRPNPWRPGPFFCANLFSCAHRKRSHIQRNTFGPAQIINYPDRGPELGSSI